MSLFERIQHRLNEAPVGKDGSILPNPSDSDKDKKITKKFIKQYPKKETTNKQTELNLGNTKTTNVPLSTKRTLKGRPLGSKTTKKPKITQPTLGVNQAEVSKKAKEFTKDINKANVKRQETVTKRKYFRGRKAQRVPGASGVKPTGSFSKGTLKSSPTGQRAYDYEKMKIDAKDQLKKDKAFDRKISKGLKKPLPKGVTPTSIVRQDVKQFMSKVKSGDPKAKKELMDIVDKDFAKKTPAKQSEQAKRIFKIQRAKGRVFNPKTGTFEPSEFQKSLRKAGASGDFSPTMPQDKRESGQKKRDARIKKYKTPDPFKVDTSKAAKQSAKAFGTPTKSQIKKLSKKPGGYRAPKGLFGIGDTKGQMTSKAMDAKAFKKTTTKDILTDPKLSKQYGVKSFQKFSRDLQDFKDRDMPGGPRKTKTTKPKISDVDDLTRQDVGMAPSNEIKYKRVQRLPGQKGPKTGVPQKGGGLAKVKNVVKPVSGTYRGVGVGQKEVTDRKRQVKSILRDLKTRKSTTVDQDALNQAQTGVGPDGEYLTKDQRKAKFDQSKGKTSGGGSGGGSGRGGGRRIGGSSFGGAGGGGGRFKGFGKKVAAKGKGFRKGLLKFVKNNRVATALALGAAGIYGFQAAKRAIEGPQLDPRKDFTKTGRIKYGTGVKSDLTNKKMAANKQKVGDNVRFSYGTMGRDDKGKRIKDPDYASPTLTKTDLEKFKNKVYTVKDSKGKTIDVNKRIQNSAFTKQLQKANKGKNQKSKDFMKKYQKQAKFRGIQ